MSAKPHSFTRSERLAALSRAASVLRNNWPRSPILTTLGDDGRGLPVVCAWDPSGGIRVGHRYSGELIALSRPAALTVLHPEVFPEGIDTAVAAAAERIADCMTALDLLELLPELLESEPLASMSGAELATHVERWRDDICNRY